VVGDAAQEILASTGCSVELAAQEDVSDQVTIRGPPAKLPLALTAAMEKASAVRVESVEVSSAHRGAPPEHARRLLRWLSLGGKIPRPAGVQVFLPRNALVESGDAAAPLSIDIVGADAEAVSNVRAQLEALVRSVPPSFVKIIDVDPLLHRFIIGKQGKGLQAYAKRGVDVIFPPAPSATNEAGTGAEGRSDVVLVLADASQLGEGDAKAKAASAESLLQSIAEEVERAAGQAADLTTEVLNVPQRFHAQILGSKGTTLNAILGAAGEDRLVSVRMGQGRGPPSAGAPAPSPADDTITVRGPSAEVARVVAELQKVAKDVQEDAIVNGHVAEFSVDAEHVRHLVGRAGASVAKLRDELGVRIDFDDAPEAGASKGPKAKGAKTKVTITGRQENVKACKERILAQAAQLADETTITLKVPQSMHGSIIGSGGKYVTRLQDNYGVRVNFPSQNAEKADEVTIRGGKKGVEEARREIVELLQYEEANNQTTTVVVSRSSIARIMGKGGATVNKIRDDTEAQIDVDRAADEAEGATTTIRIRGTKKAIDAARGAILAIAKDVDAEETFSLNIPSRFHGLLLGSGGQNLRDIIARASGGGSGDDQARLGAQLVQFPRRGDKNADPDTVIVRGPGDVARKVKDELAAAAAELADRVTVGTVVAPASQRGLMGALRELQSTHNVRILMPSFREFAAAKEESVNSAETADAAEGSVVLLVGKRAACDAAARELAQRFTAHSEQVTISRAAHAKLANQQFFRSLRATGVSADAPRVAPVAAPAAEQAAPSAGAAAARIDLDDAVDLGAGDDDDEFGFTIVELPPVTGEDVTWTLTASSPETLAAGVARLRAEADETGAITHEGRLTVDGSVVPRLVGKQGSALKQHEEASGAHIDIPRSGNGTVIIRGTRDQVLAAKERIVRAASAPARPRRD
jgi:transcription antitermination factor NusA-like protein